MTKSAPDFLDEDMRLDRDARLLDPVLKAQALYAIEESSKSAERSLGRATEVLEEMPNWVADHRDQTFAVQAKMHEHLDLQRSIRFLLRWIAVCLTVMLFVLLAK